MSTSSGSGEGGEDFSGHGGADFQRLGARLKQARVSLGLSIEDVARHLRLSARQIEALEEDNHAVLPGRTFVRGFVRNYARMTQLNEDEVLALYDSHYPAAGGGHIQAPSQQIRYSERRARPWIKGAVAAFIVISLASWGLLQWLDALERPVDALDQSREVADETVHETGAAATGDSAAVMRSDVSPALAADAKGEGPPQDEAVKAGSDTAQRSTQSAQQQEIPANASGKPQGTNLEASDRQEHSAAIVQARMVMSFTGPSWVEIRDRSGRKLHARNHDANTPLDIEGEPPFSLIIGKAPNAKLVYKGQPVDLVPHIQGDIARLKLD